MAVNLDENKKQGVITHNEKLVLSAEELAFEVLPKNQAHSSSKPQYSDQEDSDISFLTGISNERTGEKVYPASAIQTDLWTYWKLNPESPAYNTLFSCHIVSELNISALKTFFQMFIDRHEVLRATFFYKEGRVYQRIRPQEISFEVVDVVGMSENEIKKLATVEYKRPFDLENGPVSRVVVFRQSDFSHYLVSTGHHIVQDAWSLEVLLKELDMMYPSIRNGVPVVMPMLNKQYIDFVKWQYEFLNSDEGKNQLNYWKETLPKEIPQLELTSKTSKKKRTPLYEKSTSFQIPSKQLKKIQALCKKYQVTLNIFFFSVFQLLLHRYSQEDVVVTGTPMTGRLRTTHGRRRKDFLNTVGCLVNISPIATYFKKDMNFLELADQVKENYQAASKYQDVPLSWIKDILKTDTDTRLDPQASFVFQRNTDKAFDMSMFFMDNSNLNNINIGGLTVNSFFIPQQEGQLDLLWEILESNGVAYSNIKYKSALFTRDSIKRMTEHLTQIISQVLNNSKIKISEIEIVSPREKKLLLHKFNGSLSKSLKIDYVHKFFSKQASKTPENIAIVFSKAKLTYKELDQKSTQLAIYLQNKGVGSETIVGIKIERSMEMIIAILSVLKAGGAYLPIDPKVPKSRQDNMANECKVKMIITMEEINKNWKEIEKTRGKLNSNISPKNLAYVIYTSGSTGKPRGVMVEHKSLSFHMAHIIPYYNISSYDRILQTTNFCFDPSIEQIFCALLTGATLILVPDILMTPEYFGGLLLSSEVTILNLPPSYAKTILAPLLKDKKFLDENRLRKVIFGAEKLEKKMINLFLSSCLSKTCTFLNAYGPTETTITSTVHTITPDSLAFSTIPIGSDFKGVTIIILDRYKRLTPIGFLGEIYIGGDRVSKGYIGQELSEHFLRFPYYPNLVFYKTGDFGKWTSDGNILFVGRKDRQVKLRGLRIELNEIELALQDYSGVEAAIVLPYPSSSSLCAFVVSSEKKPCLSKIKDHLQSKLPLYMVPHKLVFIRSIPLTPRGKVDYKKLWNEEKKHFSSTPSVTNVSVAESKLLGIWEQKLKAKNISTLDNFFTLGGDSLGAISLIQDINEQLNTELSTSDLFNYPTINSLCRRIELIKTKCSKTNIVSFSKNHLKSATGENLFFIPGVGGNMLAFHPLVEKIQNNFFEKNLEHLSCYGVEQSGLYNDSFFASGEEMVEEYLEAIQSIQPKGPYSIVAWSYGVSVAIQIILHLIEKKEKVRCFVSIDSEFPDAKMIEGFEEAVGLQKEINKIDTSNIRKLVQFYSKTFGVKVNNRLSPTSQLSQLLGFGNRISSDKIKRLRKIVTLNLMHARQFKISKKLPVEKLIVIKAYKSIFKDFHDKWSRNCIAKESIFHELKGNHWSIMDSDELSNIISSQF